MEDRSNMTMEYLDAGGKLVIHKDIKRLTVAGDTIKLLMRDNVEHLIDLAPTSLYMFQPVEQRIAEYMESKGWIQGFPKEQGPS